MTLFNETEAAKYLGGEKAPIPVDTMRYWRCAGKGPAFIKMGRTVRYSELALDNFLEANTKTSTSDNGPEQEAAAA